MRSKGNSRNWARRFTALAALVLLVAAVDPDDGPPAQVAQARFETAMGVLEGSAGLDDYFYAIDLIGAAIVLDPDWPEPFYSLGVAYAKLGLYAEAADSFRTYLELKPGARDAAAVSGMIAVLDAKARRWFDRALVIETVASLGDTKIWQRSSPDNAAARFIPVFRVGSEGLEAEYEVNSRNHARNLVVFPVRDETRTFELRYLLSDAVTPHDGYTCAGRELCDYRVTIKVELATPRLVTITVQTEELYDGGPLMNGTEYFTYLQN